MTTKLALLIGCSLLGGCLPSVAQIQISLDSSSVIGGSPVFSDNAYTVGTYAAGNIFNQQSGAVDMTTQVGNAWFPSEVHGITDRFVTIDLGTPTPLSSIEIFNSNQADRGTAHFRLDGGNSITAGTDDGGIGVGSILSSPVALLGSTAVSYDPAPGVVTGQSFAISDATAYRYLQLTLVDGQSFDPLSGVGLAEVKFFSAVPEPSTYGTIFAASALVFGIWRRRQTA